MDLALARLHQLAPWLPDDHDLRPTMDLAGIEVKSISDSTVGIELLANRGDHRSYEGVLRELAAHIRPAGASSIVELDVEYADLESSIRDATAGWDGQHSLAYELLAFGCDEMPDDPWGPIETEMLSLAGVDAGAHPVVAATNLVALELGQPLHAFDADLLVGTPTVRLSAEGESVLLIGHDEPTELPDGVLVIADDERVVAIAGVLGGQHTAVSASTTSFLVESACFSPTLVRRSAQRLRLSSLASQRFERGGDPGLPTRGLARLVAILDAAGCTMQLGTLSRLASWDGSTPDIALSAGDVNRLLGTDLAAAEVVDRLRWFGFDSLDGEVFTVPSWRIWDVEEKADLIEEIAQSVDYNSLPEDASLVPSGALPSEEDRFRTLAGAALQSSGFYEIFGETFHDETTEELLRGYVPTLDGTHDAATVRLVNSVDPRHGLLRRSCVPTALTVVSQNVNSSVARGLVFEWATVFSRSDDEWGVEERNVLWFAAFDRTGRAEDLFRRVHGAIDELALRCARPLDIGRAEVGERSAYHRHQTVHVLIDGETVGAAGGLKPANIDGIGLGDGSLVYAELDYPAVLRSGARPAEPERPIRSDRRMERRLSFRATGRTEFGEIAAGLRHAAASHDVPVRVLFDSEFEGDDGTRSITVELAFDRDMAGSRAQVNELVLSIGEQTVAAIGDGLSLRSG